MAVFNLTRRAANASYSDRTAKIGRVNGTLADAVKRAADLSQAQGEVTITDEAGLVGTVSTITLADRGCSTTAKPPQARVQLSLPPAWVAELLAR